MDSPFFNWSLFQSWLQYSLIAQLLICFVPISTGQDVHYMRQTNFIVTKQADGSYFSKSPKVTLPTSCLDLFYGFGVDTNGEQLIYPSGEEESMVRLYCRNSEYTDGTKLR